MGTTSPRARETPDAAGAVRAAPDTLALLAARVEEKLAKLEAALLAAGGEHQEKAHRDIDELRDLLARQGAFQEAIDERIENQVEERTRELASLTNFLQTHSEREKALLARELHDALGGILTPAKMDLAWLEAKLGDHPEYGERMRRLGALIDHGIDLKRRIIENLRPSLLDHLGLASALHWYVEETCRSSGIECRLMISERLERLPADLEIALYRLVQESVANIVKHAKAKVLDLNIERTAEGLKLGIADDGLGIADIEQAKRLSHGLAGMMHRVRSVGGTFDVRSQPGKGTRIEVFVPLKAK
jgi:signal transduction histidine kinase